MSNIYKNCKKITNTKSKEYKNYKDQTSLSLNAIVCVVVCNLIFDVPFILRLMLPLNSNARAHIVFYLITLISGTLIFFWRKIKYSSFFYQFSSWEKLSTHIDVQNHRLLYEQATKQLAKNKTAVKLSFKLFQNVFIIFVVGTVEDNIKQYIWTWFNNLGSISNIIEACVVTSGVIICFLFFCNIISYPIFILNSLITYLKHIIDTCIDHGMFVRNYALLNATIKIIETEYKNKLQD